MPLIDVILDANNETTPEFSASDIGPHFAATVGTYIQGVRESGTSTITIAFEGCVPEEDGTKNWHGISTFTVPGAVGGSEMHRRTDIVRGCRYRCRYASNSTNDIRILVAGDGDKQIFE